MNKFGFIGLAAALIASPAAAESGSPFHDLMNMSSHSQPAHQARGTIMTPSVKLPGAAETWVEKEITRQAASPRSVAKVSMDIDETLDGAIRRTAREQRVGTLDVSMAILLQVMYGAREKIAREVEGRDDEASADRLARAEADFQAVLPLQSQTSLYLATR